MPFKPDSTSGSAVTRATKLTSVSSFKLYAYSASGTAIADGVTYTKSGNSWTTTSKVFWPQTGNVTFYAFSPASNSSVSFNTSTKTLTYTAPTGESSQQDVLYAYKTSARPTNNTVDLTFNHANAAFSVNARLATGCTATVNVSGVSLVNVKPTNTLTFTNGNATASGNNISSTLACSAKTLTTSNQAISSSPLIIPPQSVTAWSGTGSLANTYLAVTCKVSENDNYVVGSASSTGTVYVPMDKTLNKGEDNSVNLVLGTLSDGKRSYGRDDKGNRITVSEKREKELFNTHVAVDLGLSVKWASDVFWSNLIGGEFRSTFGYSQYTNTSYNARYWSYLPSGSWSAPTKDQVQELLDNCTMTIDTVLVSYSTENPEYTLMVSFFVTSQNDTIVNVPGYRFTSKINGNSIFFPSLGYETNNGSINMPELGSNGYYWTSYSENGLYYFLEWGPDSNGNYLSPHLSTTTDKTAGYALKFVCP